VRRRGRLVEKDELMQAVWPDTVVEEINLARNISTLRKALSQVSDDGGQPFIQTVPKHGYRFVAEVRVASAEVAEVIVQESKLSVVVEEEEEEESGESGERERGRAGERERLIPSIWAYAQVLLLPLTRSPALPVLVALGLLLAVAAVWLWRGREEQLVTPGAVKSIAILPFKSLNPKPDAQGNDEYLGVGLADVLITRLSNVSELAVRPTKSVLRFAEKDPLQAGRELRVDSVLDGSVQQSGNRVRVTLRLLRVADNQPLWAYQCDETCTDVFALQDTISQKVTEALALKLTGDEQRRLVKRYTENVEAYRAYLKGRYHYLHFSLEDIDQGIASFQQALKLDANYALAYAGLAALYSAFSGEFAAPHEYKPKARALAEQALKLDEHLAEAHAVLARVRCYYDWDYAGAEQEFKRALALNPNLADTNMWYGEYLALMGRFDEALVAMKRAAQLDPLSPFIAMQAGFPFYLSNRYDEALEYLRQGLALGPRSRAVRINLGITCATKGESAKAVAELQQLIQSGDRTLSAQIFLAFAQARAGDRAAAQATLKQVLSSHTGYVASYPVATVYAALGEHEQAFAWLERAYTERSEYMVWLKTDPRLNSLRADPRFADLLQRVGVTAVKSQ
jgi:TolB-like protein/DNA-binding winged helix-turn-helix (wHTH) protein/Flp pilus assembly protein TadD